MGLFDAIITVESAAPATKLDRGTRPYMTFQVLKDQGKPAEEAYKAAYQSFLKVPSFGPAEAKALYFAAMDYAKHHKVSVVSKSSGKSIEVIDGLSAFHRPIGSIRALLEGKPVQDPEGMLLHVVDMIHAAKAELYLDFQARFKAELDKPAAGTILEPKHEVKAKLGA